VIEEREKRRVEERRRQEAEEELRRMRERYEANEGMLLKILARQA